MSERTNRKIVLASRPPGMPTLENFRLEEEAVPEITDGQYLVRNLWLSLDPYMRGRMSERASYASAVKIDSAMEGETVAQVVESKNPGAKVGDIVVGRFDWQDYRISSRPITKGWGVRKLEPDGLPISTALGIVGMPGMTAYFGLNILGKPKKGETLVVSAASGAVGAAVGQIGKIKGLRVVGVAGGEIKCKYCVDELGFDACVDYKSDKNLDDALREACPDGIDIYFENVGGEHLQAALNVMNQNARIAVCGMISNYNAAKPMPGPNNMFHIIGKRLTLKGFIISDHYDRLPQFFVDMSQWIAEGKIKWKETVFEGLENAPKAFIGLFDGQNFGKMLVKIGPESMM